MISTKRTLTTLALAASMFLAGQAVPVFAGKPGGVGMNLHRRFMIQQAQKNAREGKPVRKHAGIWIAGGFKSTVYKQPTRRYYYWRR